MMQQNATEASTRVRRDRFLSRYARRGLVTAAVLALILVITVVVVLSPPVRPRVLEFAVRKLDKRLPGTLMVEKARWPSLGSIELTGIVWTDVPDTLFLADRAFLSLDLKSLLVRDLSVSDIELTGVRADLASIQARFPDDGQPAETPGQGKKLPFFRTGSLSGVPSVKVGRCEVTASQVILSEETTLRDIALGASLNLLRDAVPFVGVSRLSVRSPETGWSIDEGALDFDLNEGVFAGAFRGRAAPDLPLNVEVDSPARDSIQVELRLGERDGEPPVLSARGRIDRRRNQVRGLQLAGRVNTPGTAGLRRIPALRPRLEAAPDLEGLVLEMNGTVRFQPELEADLGLDLLENAWIGGGSLRARIRGPEASVDSLVLRMEDLHLRAKASVREERLSGEARLRVSGARWLRTLFPDASPPDSLWADLEVQGEGPSASPVVTVRAQAAGRRGGFTLDRLEMNAEIPVGSDRPVHFDARAFAREHGVALRGRMQPGKPLMVQLEPVRIRHGQPVSLPPPSASPAIVSWDEAAGTLELKDVRVTGDLGSIQASGRLPGSGTGTVQIDAEWVEIPPFVLQRFVPSDSLRHVVAGQFAAHGPARFLVGVTGLDLSTGRARARGRLSLPGPDALHPFLPEGVDLSDWRGIRASFDIEATSPSSLSGRLSLQETEWLEKGSLSLHRKGQDIVLDSLVVATEGFSARLRGGLGAESLDLEGEAALDAPRLLARLAPAWAESLSAAADVSLAVTGTREAPQVSVELRGDYRRGRVEVPEVRGAAFIAADRLEATLAGVRGLRANDLALDRWLLGLDGTGLSRPFPMNLRLEAAGPEASALGAFSISRETGIEIQADTLMVAYQDLDLRNVRPFRLSVLPQEPRLEIEGLDLRGRMGTVIGDGFTSRDSSDLKLDIQVALPADPPQPTWPAGLWPRSLEIGVRAGPGRRLGATATAGGLRLDPGTETAVRIEIDTEREETRLTTRIADSQRTYLTGRGRLSGGVSLYPPGVEWNGEDIRFEMAADGLPLPLDTFGVKGVGERPARLDARIQVGGSLREPVARSVGRLSFPGWPRLADYVVSYESRTADPKDREPEWRPEAGFPALLAPAAPGDSGFAAAFRVTKSDRDLIRGSISYPSRLGGGRPDLQDTPLQLRIDSELLDLADFDALLPTGTHVVGAGQFRLTASGPPASAVLDGAVQARELRLSTADGTRVSLDMNLTLGGTVKRPAVRGGVQVQGGVIRIPEPPKDLHPETGTSFLWEVSDTVRSETAPDPRGLESAPSPPEAAALDMDVQVTISSGFWIRGRDLEVELGGNLTVVQRGTTPTVTGELRAVQGRLLFLGRTFLMDRGTVVFYGEDEVNPSLDLALSSRIQNTRVFIQVGGTTLKPELALSSDPEMQEGDIMSLLLFGRPLDQLDSDQVGLLQDRAREIAATMATARLEAGLSRQLGLDMLTIKRGEGDDGDRVVFGKYLSRRALLKYEQALESGIRFFINLEYQLTRHLRLETLIGPQSNSAVELNWSTEY